METRAIVLHPSQRGLVPENPEARRSEDQDWINIHEPYELRDWAIYFSVSRMRVAEAVMAVGTRVEDVKRFLGK